MRRLAKSKAFWIAILGVSLLLIVVISRFPAWALSSALADCSYLHWSPARDQVICNKDSAIPSSYGSYARTVFKSDGSASRNFPAPTAHGMGDCIWSPESRYILCEAIQSHIYPYAEVDVYDAQSWERICHFAENSFNDLACLPLQLDNGEWLHFNGCLGSITSDGWWTVSNSSERVPGEKSHQCR